MKANLYSLTLFIFMTAGLSANAQPARVMVTSSYYDGYDYHFSSRINRFHRSYTAFNYYAPVFTDVYWYNYQPFSWGLSIYGGGGFGIGYSNYPVYNYGYYDGWYDPYYGGYDPFYYNRWYAPVVISINFRNRWHSHNNYWYGNNYYGYNRNTYSNYYSSPRYSNTRSGSTGIYRRESTPVNRTADRQNTEVTRSQDNGRRLSDRNVAERTNNRNDINNGNNTNNGNTGNNTNNGNNGNNGNRYWDDNNPNPNTGNRYGNNNANEGKPGNTNNIYRSQSPVIRNMSPASSNSGIRSNAGSIRQTNVQKSSSARSGSSVSQGRSSTSRSSSVKASTSSRSSSAKASSSSRSSSSTSRSSRSR